MTWEELQEEKAQRRLSRKTRVKFDTRSKKHADERVRFRKSDGWWTPKRALRY